MRVSMSAIGSLMLILSPPSEVRAEGADEPPLALRERGGGEGAVNGRKHIHPYQLALTTPGISPCIAISRSLLRPRPNLRNTPRGRPVSLHRLRSRVGLESRGSCCSFCLAARRSSSESLMLAIVVCSSARF